ncbi:MAG: hypothetical protein HYR85_04120 [Planctomycetes bacterium]|nr:hypothetical protein [Planctomycetota bacterium]MBI3844877.1 hypothetical protein [Planctomycetota bacterium]
MDFTEAYNAVQDYIERRYGIPVVISDVVDPNTGDFNGVEIHVDFDMDPEMALFIVLHLFGHTVQWNVSKELRDLGIESSGSLPDLDPARLERIRRYEQDASRYSLRLLHDAGITEFDAWLARWVEADWRYLENFYHTGARADFRAFFRSTAEPLTPLDIPAFTPQRWVSRWSF